MPPIVPPPATPATKVVLPPVKNGTNPLDKLKQQIAQNKKELAVQEEQQQETPVAATPVLNEPITQAAFEQAWIQYHNQLHSENKMSLLMILKNAKWQLSSEHQVQVVLASQHESEMFEEERINIIPFFRKTLKNTLFEIAVIINSTVIHKKVFTAEDKFAAMAEKNPLLNDLRKLLALDLE